MQTKLDCTERFFFRTIPAMKKMARNRKFPEASKKTKAPTLRDVARLAQVNISTVSRFLNGKASLSEHTANLIRSAIAQTGYQAVPEHRRKGNRLGSQTSKLPSTVCLVLVGKFDLRWIADYSVVYAYLISGVRQAAHAAGVDLVLRHAATKEELQAVLCGIGFDGCLLLGDDPSVADLPERIHLKPMVKLFGDTFSTRWDTLSYSNIETGRIAARYLTQKNCSAVGCLSGPDTHGIFGIRSISFEMEARAAGVEVISLPRLKFGDLSEVCLEQAHDAVGAFVKAIKQANQQVDGLFVTQDHLLPLLWPALQKAGLEPCRDIALIGCNNELPHLRSLYPRPASIDIRAEEIGRIAIQQLLWRVAHPGEPCRTVLLPPVLLASPSDFELSPEAQIRLNQNRGMSGARTIDPAEQGINSAAPDLR